MATDLRVDDVCRILEAGAKSGVQELKYLGLFVKYGQPAVRETIWGEFSPPGPVPEHLRSPTPPPDLTAAQHENLAKQTLAHDELDLRKEQMADLLITDPARYEEMLQNGELDEPSGHDGPGLSAEAESDE